jgi:hypothetical protein
MTIYSAGFSVPGVNSANTVLAQLRTAATDRAKIIEVGIFIGTAPTTAPDIGFGRTSGAGTTPTQVANGAADPADPAATALVDTGWATRPTYTAAPYLRRLVFPVTIGAGVIWQFTNPIILAVSTAVGFVNIAATGATVGQFSGYFVWDE